MTDSSIYITIDVDWACDEVLEYTIDFLERNEIKATFFVTHDTPLLKRLRQSPLFELGIHPNFQALLNGNSDCCNMEEVLDRILEIVPEAVSVRCHSLVQSSPLLDLFKAKGLKYDVNLFIPWESGIELRPIRHWNGMLRIPYCWEDDVACVSGNWIMHEGMSDIKGLKVFTFHPIHLYLNTECIERYERAKEYQRNINKLKEFTFLGARRIGSFCALDNIMKFAIKRKLRVKQIKEIGNEAI